MASIIWPPTVRPMIFADRGCIFTNKRCYDPDGLAINLKNNRYTKPDPVRTIAKIDEGMGFEPVGPKEILSTIYDVLKELGIEDTARGDINKAQTWANSQSALDASPKPTTPRSSRPKNRGYRKRAEPGRAMSDRPLGRLSRDPQGAEAGAHASSYIVQDKRRDAWHQGVVFPLDIIEAVNKPPAVSGENVFAESRQRVEQRAHLRHQRHGMRSL